MKALNRELAILFSINVAIGLTSQLVQPLFPLYLKEIGATDIENALVISVGNLTATLLMLPSGALMNRYGKKVFLVLASILSGVSVLLMAFTSNWTIVIPLNMLLNASMCLFVPSRMALIAENATPTNRASLFGVMNLAWPIGGVVGPLLGGYLAESVGWGSVFIIAGAVSLIAIYPALKVKDADRVPEPSAGAREGGASIRDKKYLVPLTTLFGLQTLVTTSMAGINMILPIYLRDRFGLSYALIGAFFTASNVLLLFTQLGGGYIADRHGRRKLLLVCAALAPVAIASWVLFDNWVALLAVYSIAFGLWSLTWPPILAILTDLLPARLRGTGFGLNMTGSRLGFTLGPIVASMLYLVPGSSIPFIAAAVIYALAFPLTYLLKDEAKTEKPSIA
ncbi:MAG: MFS transporter [Candidatus Bathyarchaeota archaeon]|nr:MFS transporter [Candidatus Bathyarchaeota archaeon]